MMFQLQERLLITVNKLLIIFLTLKILLMFNLNYKKIIISFSLLFFFLSFTDAQNKKSPVLLTIGEESITKAEFLDIYNKNNVKDAVLNKNSLSEYLNLYINFKLKVKEAEALGIDTISSIKKELKGYREQLAKPYLIDEETNAKLILEAYNRMKYDIRASHILIKLSPNPTPDDTLKAYKKIMKIRDRILKGEDFNILAAKLSDDLSARDRKENHRIYKGNKGDLGYFTVFDMIYPFETAAYNTNIGDVSMPIRTEYGYHIIKVTDKRPAMGKVLCAHILLLHKENSTKEDSAELKNKIFKIYNELESGESFESLASKYSDDKKSAINGGKLPWFGPNKMVPEFIETVYNLKNIGDYSKPILTQYGWHIIKLIDQKKIGSFEENKEKIKKRLAKDSRANKSKISLVKKIKKEYGFNENIKAKNIFYKLVNQKVFNAKWNFDKNTVLNKTLITIGNKNYSQKDFADFIVLNQKRETPIDLKKYIDKKYNEFKENKCIEYEDSQLEKKYPEFKAIVKEYRDGILLFEFMNRNIWDKAIKDSTGLENFYKNNLDKYQWDERLDASIYTFKNNNSKIIKKVKKLVKKSVDEKTILEQINSDTTKILSIKTDKFLKDNNEIIKSIKWEKGISKTIVSKDGTASFVKVNRIIPKGPKKLNEARGIIISDYQKYLEDEKIKELKKKYPVIINQEVFNTMIK